MLALAVVLIAMVGLYSRCTKVNTDQPCGLTDKQDQLFKDADNRCYYIDQSTHNKIYVDKSICNCY